MISVNETSFNRSYAVIIKECADQLSDQLNRLSLWIRHLLTAKIGRSTSSSTGNLCFSMGPDRVLNTHFTLVAQANTAAAPNNCLNGEHMQGHREGF